MMTEVVIRPYETRDQAVVRTIAWDTADRGESAERLFPDREAVGELLTRYYIEHEPGALWVAEHEGVVIGYLTGCLDSRRYWRMVISGIGVQAVLRAILRGALGHRSTWRLIKAAIGTWWRGGFQRRVSLDHFPAHLHVNVRRGFRGQQVGRRLVERFLDQANAEGLHGVHAVVNEENQRACRFFEQLGFTVLSRHQVVRPDGQTYRLHDTVTYGKQLSRN